MTQIAHFIDDFVTASPLGSKECWESKQIMHEVCEDVGLPVEHEKDEGPASLPGTLKNLLQKNWSA